MDWKKIKKIDAHVHVLPDERLKSYKQYAPNSPWSHADIEEYMQAMDEYNVEKAVLMPINDGNAYFEHADDTNRWFGEVQKKYPDKFIAFADVLKNGADFMTDAPRTLEKAVKEYGLKGLKLHPQNLCLDADSLEYVPVLRKAAELKVPVVIHSNNCRRGMYENSSPDKISHMIQVFPDVNIITAHMGGMRWHDAILGCSYVDISGMLLDFVKLYGIEQTNRILRAFGAHRLIFATDYPDVWYSKPNEVLKDYCDILNKMDFTEKEAEMIAYGNISRILGI